MKQRVLAATLTILSCIGWFALPVQALSIPAAPPLERPIIDTSSTLTTEHIDRLSAQIRESRTARSYQVGIVMIDSLEGGTIEDFSIKTARQWGIGDKSKDNGILIAIAKKDRKIRIETGNKVDDELTDVEANRIIRNTMAPHFRENKYYEGLAAAITEIERNVDGVSGQNTKEAAANNFSFAGVVAHPEALFFLGILFYGIGSWVVSMLARTKSWWAGGVAGGVIGMISMFIMGFALISVIGCIVLVVGGFALDYVVSRNFRHAVRKGQDPAWWAGGTHIGGWGGGTGGGGGFPGGGSFGGGGFSGGGSSGDW